MKKIMLISAILILMQLTLLDACTVISAADGDIILGGTNKDWDNINTRIKVIPSSEGKYGRIYFGYQVAQGFQNVGGINEHGLWYDGASLPERYDIVNYYNKPTVQGELCEKALEECENVQEVIDMYSAYYTPHWDGHSMWGDSEGNAVIIEFGERDVTFIRRQGLYQVMTNFYVSDSTDHRWYNSYRFRVANYLFENAPEINDNLFKRILRETHQVGVTPTLFSNIYDLKNMIVYIYNFHDYAEVVQLDVEEELQKGENYYVLPELFHQVRLHYPVEAESIFSSEVTFSWFGNADTYEVRYSTDPDFSDYGFVIYGSYSSNLPHSYISLIGMGCMFIGSICAKKRSRKHIIMLILISLYFSGCSLDVITSPYEPSQIKHELEVSDLQPNTVYYWKVIACGDDGINSESEAQVFVTREL